MLTEWIYNHGWVLAAVWFVWIASVAVWMRVDCQNDPDEERELGGEAGGA